MQSSLTLQRWFTLIGAPIIWIAHFGISYVIVSLVCALQLTELQIAGLDLAQLGIALITVLSLFLIGWIALVQARRWRNPPGPDPDMNRFFAINTLLLCAVSALALLWVAFPAAVLPTCAA